MFRFFKPKNKINIISKEKKDANLEKHLNELQDEIEEICAEVDSKYNRESGKIILNPLDYKHFYKDIDDLVEKTEVMVIEYIQQLKKKEKNCIIKSHYEGLNKKKMCVYSITKESSIIIKLPNDS